jgi:rare lipoprotein A
MGTRYTLILVVLLFLGGCAGGVSRPTSTGKPAGTKAPAPQYGGGYYQDDGPGDNPPPNLEAVPDAVPRAEPLHRFANRPYTVLGQTFVPDTRFTPYKERGHASWYGRKYNGKNTSSGELYDMYAMTAAHPTLPIPSYVRVTNPANGKAVVVRVNDRGPFLSSRLIDLSYTAAYKLGLLQNGSGLVEVELIDPNAASAAPAAAEAQPDPAPAPAAETAIPLDAEKTGYFLQLGAFSAQQNAESFGARIRDQLGQQGSALHVHAKNGLFRVHLGPYASQEEARTAAAKVQESLALTPVVVVR